MTKYGYTIADYDIVSDPYPIGIAKIRTHHMSYVHVMSDLAPQSFPYPGPKYLLVDWLKQAIHKSICKDDSSEDCFKSEPY